MKQYNGVPLDGKYNCSSQLKSNGGDGDLLDVIFKTWDARDNMRCMIFPKRLPQILTHLNFLHDLIRWYEFSVEHAAMHTSADHSMIGKGGTSVTLMFADEFQIV